MKRIILAGGGHGHINVLKNLIQNPLLDYEILLITDFKKQYYSGMLAGFIEGIYTEQDISFDVEKLSKMANVRYIEEKIIAIDKANQKVITSKGKYPYDFLSINLGSLSNINFPIKSEDVCLVKPIKNVVDAKDRVSEMYRKNPRLKISFIGAGASGVELGLAFRAAFPEAEISIMTTKNILENFNKSAKNKLKKLLDTKSIKIITGQRVNLIKDKKIHTNDDIYDFDFAFITTGFCGPDINFDGFMTFNNNYLAVNNKLFADKNVLAMGDAASIKEYPTMPKAGVYAIREAPILYQNLLKLINGDNDFINYKPQKKYLQIINCGNKRAMSNYGSLSNYGKISWKIKDKIDRDYMKI
ncbi:FAD-dependent oxidoreductase [uncultured Anaerococcus sp.]|uniref:FAD-dependent oxidoreductase n=1 Tax=uncultured Anaerococcus sp. TaxID=293428 RepID=UPI0025CC059E|nr:FAD-dependent oxidoreductase [uncultured Anaerococcus sp.]